MRIRWGGRKESIKNLDWKGVGQFVAVFVQLVTAIVAVFKKAKVGLEIMGWLITEGKFTLEIACQNLAEAYAESLKHIDVIKIPKNIDVIKMPDGTLQAEIDLDVDPDLPFTGAAIETRHKYGKVIIEKRLDGKLYISGRKVILHRSERQQSGRSIRSHELGAELDKRPVQNACILDFLLENQEFFPEDWKQRDENGDIVHILFWGTVYGAAAGSFVRSVCWKKRVWHEDCFWFITDVKSNYLAAELEE